jgi:hypothetical protein
VVDDAHPDRGHFQPSPYHACIASGESIEKCVPEPAGRAPCELPDHARAVKAAQQGDPEEGIEKARPGLAVYERD